MKQVILSDDPEQTRQQIASLTPDEREAFKNQVLIELARGEGVEALEAYCYYTHQWRLAPHHLEWAGYLIRGDRVCISAPPESGKSRLVRAWQEWNIGRNPDTAGLLIQNTKDQGKSQIGSISSVLKSKRYRDVFPHIKPSEHWSTEQITVERETHRPDATVSAYGIAGAYQGKHVDTIVIDDPTDQKDVLSPAVILSQSEHLRGVLIDRLNKGGNLFVILTRWSPNDLVPTLEQLGVRVINYPAWKPATSPYPWDAEPDGKCEGCGETDCATNIGRNQMTGEVIAEHIKHTHSLLYSDQYNETELIEKREMKGDDFFRLTFLCQPEAAIRGDVVFPKLSIAKNYTPIRTSMNWVRTTLGVDFGTTQSHKSALVVLSKADSGLVVVRASWTSPLGSTAEIAEVLGEWKVRYGLRSAYIDASQGSLVDTFTHILKIQGFKGNRWVYQRIGTISTMMDTGRFIIDPAGPGAEEMYQSLAGYRYDENGKVIELGDDLCDALGYAACAIEDPSRTGIGPMVEIVDKTALKNRRFSAGVDVDNFDPVKEFKEIQRGKLPDKHMGNWGI